MRRGSDDMFRRLTMLGVLVAAAGCASPQATAPDSGSDLASTSAAPSPTATPAAALDADHIFSASVPGYAFVQVPKSLEQQARRRFASSSGMKRHDAQVDLQSITKDGEGMGVVLVVTLSPEFAALPGTDSKSFAVGIAESASSTPRKVDLGPIDGYIIDNEGQIFVAWQDENLLVALIGEGEAPSIAAARAVVDATAS
jgi:hypothetical protein